MVSEAPMSLDNPPSGTLPMIFYTLRTATNSEMVSGGQGSGGMFEVILLNHANPIAALVLSQKHI